MSSADERAPRTLTVLLRDWRAGAAGAADELLPMIYDELHRLAARALRGERPGHTWRPTDLVSEAYLRLAAGAQPDWQDRVHFFAIAARHMRQILVDHARRRSAGKRGGGAAPVELEDAIAPARDDELLAIDAALDALAALDERKAKAVEMHYFGGMTHEEIAAALGVHVATVGRDLRFAEAWIQRQLAGL